MRYREKDVEEKTRDLPEPVKTLVAVCMRNTDCGEEEIRLLSDPELQLPLKFYLYACIADKYPLKILKELSECTSNTALQKKRKSYEAAAALSGYLGAARQAAEEWQSRAEAVLGKAEVLISGHACMYGEEADRAPGSSGYGGKYMIPAETGPPESPEREEEPNAGETGRPEDNEESSPDEKDSRPGSPEKRIQMLEEETKEQRAEVSRYRDAVIRWKKMAAKLSGGWCIFNMKARDLISSLQAFQIGEEAPADPEEIRTDFMIGMIRDGSLSQVQMEILERGYENGFTIRELHRLLEARAPEVMEQTFTDISYGRQRIEVLREAAANRDKNQTGLQE